MYLIFRWPSKQFRCACKILESPSKTSVYSGLQIWGATDGGPGLEIWGATAVTMGFLINIWGATGDFAKIWGAMGPPQPPKWLKKSTPPKDVPI